MPLGFSKPLLNYIGQKSVGNFFWILHLGLAQTFRTKKFLWIHKFKWSVGAPNYSFLFMALGGRSDQSPISSFLDAHL